MRAVVQRVKSAGVDVEGRMVARIGKGLLAFIGIAEDDTEADMRYICEKLVYLRVFEDAEGKMNLDITESGGAILCVSQFTLYGDCRKGRRPSFIKAGPPEKAQAKYESFLAMIGSYGIEIRSGEFQAMMDVNLINDGPVTILLDSRKQF